MHDMIYQNDKLKMMNFVSRTCIKWDTYRTRQERYLRLMNKEDDIEEVPEEEVVSSVPESQFFRVVKSKTEVNYCQKVYDIITKAFYRTSGWKELPHGLNLGATWNLLWTWGKVALDYKKLLVFQKINHFTNIKRRAPSFRYFKER